MRKGLALFPESAGRGFRRRRILFVLLLVLAAAALTWPAYDLFSGIRPFVLGLPLSMAWVIFWIVLIFAGILLLFLADSDD